MTASKKVDNVRFEKALEYCVNNIRWYEDHAGRARLLHRTFQSAVVVLAGLSPILVLWSDIPGVVQALPAALAAIVAGISGFWRWQENWIRFSHTAETLKGERIAFETRTTEAYSANLRDQQLLDNFVTRVRSVVLSETLQWRTQLSQDSSAQQGPALHPPDTRS
jgi:hypothetical protein